MTQFWSLWRRLSLIWLYKISTECFRATQVKLSASTLKVIWSQVLLMVFPCISSTMLWRIFPLQKDVFSYMYFIHSHQRIPIPWELCKENILQNLEGWEFLSCVNIRHFSWFEEIINILILKCPQIPVVQCTVYVFSFCFWCLILSWWLETQKQPQSPIKAIQLFTKDFINVTLTSKPMFYVIYLIWEY